MNSNNLQFNSILNELNKTKGVTGSIIVDSGGEVLENDLKEKENIDLFGPMAQVINRSSQKLLNSIDMGNIGQVLLESKKGKILFIPVDNVHLIILIQNNAHLGMILRAAYHASKLITNKKNSSALEAQIIGPKEVRLEKELNSTHKLSEKHSITENKSSELKVEEVIIENKPLQENSPPKTPEKGSIEEEVIQSPPKSGTDILIPENLEDRTKIILDIYEDILSAMAIGASKIMGESPAKGLIKKFLPLNECGELLANVKVKEDGSLDFNMIRKNAEKISIQEREEIFIRDFSHMIGVLTDNFGRVMGYDAFRGMIKPELRVIGDNFRDMMKELKIIQKIHPEIRKLLI
jgi:predicted regulator of Ras-like GTPase activity (Roadblock/LC7/MglB family)